MTLVGEATADIIATELLAQQLICFRSTLPGKIYAWAQKLQIYRMGNGDWGGTEVFFSLLFLRQLRHMGRIKEPWYSLNG